MSAYICSPVHINTIVTWAVNQRVIAQELAQSTAERLYSENVRSVNYRYGERTKRTGFVYCPVNIDNITPMQIIKLCHCLDYQSCEHPQWLRSKAKQILVGIIDRATMRMPGYDEAKWSI